MSITKHQIFKINISNDSKDTFDNAVLKKIDSFLAESNNVYINHSISVLTEDIEEYGNFKSINKYILLSLVYKDLNATEFNLKGTSEKVKEIVNKEIVKGEKIQEPKIETEFDKKIKKAKFPEIIKELKEKINKG